VRGEKGKGRRGGVRGHGIRMGGGNKEGEE
jgi:hypothetical protein